MLLIYVTATWILRAVFVEDVVYLDSIFVENLSSKSSFDSDESNTFFFKYI